jgi:hypothetical protein
LAAKLGVSCNKIRRCHEAGLLKAHEYKEGHYLYDEAGPEIVTQIPQLKRHARLKGAHATNEVQYAT